MIYCSFPQAQYASHKDEIDRAVLKALSGETYILGEEVKRFEGNFASYCEVGFGVGVNSGTDALIIALKALDITVGDEVITTAHTALATIAAIVAVGAVPVLCDIKHEDYTINADKLEELITKKTKAIIPVHIYGKSVDMDKIIGIASEYRLKVIEDCAQSAGGVYKGRRLGSIGDIGCFSFYPTKNLGAAGDGGMLITSDPKIAERASAFRQYGWDQSRKTLAPGINSRLDEVQAAILNVKLKYLDEENRKRQKIANYYNEALAGKVSKVPKLNLSEESVFHLYVIEVDDRRQLKTTLEKNGIYPGIHYETPVYMNGGYSSLCRVPKDGLAVTDNIVKKILSLPMYPELNKRDIEEITSFF